MKGDSNDCNTILVSKYPTRVCPRYITKMALHLQDSRAFTCPTGSPFIVSDLTYAVEITSEDFSFVEPRLKNEVGNDLTSKMKRHHQRLQRFLNEANQVFIHSSDSPSAKFEVLQPHVRLWATSHILLHKLHKLQGLLRRTHEVTWPPTLLGDYLGPYQ